MAKRYELFDQQWRKIADLLPGKIGDPGRSGDGKWKSVHKRFTRWAKTGVWERVFDSLTADPDNDYLMLDSSLVRAHQQAATGKGGIKTRLWGVREAD